MRLVHAHHTKLQHFPCSLMYHVLEFLLGGCSEHSLKTQYLCIYSIIRQTNKQKKQNKTKKIYK